MILLSVTLSDHNYLKPFNLKALSFYSDLSFVGFVYKIRLLQPFHRYDWSRKK